LSPDAAADARAARALLRIRQHNRVSRRAIPLASGSLAGRSLSHHSRADGAVDVRALEAWADRRTAQSAGQDDVVLHAGLHDRAVPEFCRGAESVLRLAKPVQSSAAIPDREAPPAAGAGSPASPPDPLSTTWRGGTRVRSCSPIPLSRLRQPRDAARSP